MDPDDPRREMLRELLLLRNEYHDQIGEAHTLEEVERVQRMIRELSACIDRLRQELAREAN